MRTDLFPRSSAAVTAGPCNNWSQGSDETRGRRRRSGNLKFKSKIANRKRALSAASLAMMSARARARWAKLKAEHRAPAGR